MGELHLNVKPVIIKTREKQGDVSMEVTIYREPCWLLEAAELVYGLVNQVPVERMTASGAYCIPAGEVKRIQEAACAGISPEDPAVSYYFRGVRLEGESNRLSCLSCTLLYSSLELGCSGVDEMVQALSRDWHDMRREGYRVEEIDGFSVSMEPKACEDYPSLALELVDLPAPKVYRMQLLEVLSAFDEHLERVAELLRPVAEALPELMAPWVRRAGELVEQWEAFFRAYSAQEFLLRRARVKAENIQSLEMAFRYIAPAATPGKLREADGRMRFHMGVSLRPSMERPSVPEQPEEWELTAMRLMASSARAEMLRLMADVYMSAQELAQRLNLNSGSVFRDLNSLYNARLLLSQTIDGRNYYRTNLPVIRQITEHMMDYLQGKEQ